MLDQNMSASIELTLMSAFIIQSSHTDYYHLKENDVKYGRKRIIYSRMRERKEEKTEKMISSIFLLLYSFSSI
jgi:hypothetical protein